MKRLSVVIVVGLLAINFVGCATMIDQALFMDMNVKKLVPEIAPSRNLRLQEVTHYQDDDYKILSVDKTEFDLASYFKERFEEELKEEKFQLVNNSDPEIPTLIVKITSQSEFVPSGRSNFVLAHVEIVQGGKLLATADGKRITGWLARTVSADRLAPILAHKLAEIFKPKSFKTEVK